MDSAAKDVRPPAARDKCAYTGEAPPPAPGLDAHDENDASEEYDDTGGMFLPSNDPDLDEPTPLGWLMSLFGWIIALLRLPGSPWSPLPDGIPLCPANDGSGSQGPDLDGMHAIPDVTVDSGAGASAASPKTFPGCSIEPSAGSRSGQPTAGAWLTLAR